MKHWILWLLFTGLCLSGVKSWDTDELEIFDLVEEINTNFYVLLGVPQDAESSEIRKAYRRLSLVLHPDKNDAPDAEIKFRQLVSVYDVLKDSNKRAHYDQVLINGLPDWKHAVYYYRRVRKMGLAEMSIILFVLFTVGQYIVSWAAYAEKKYTAEQFVNMKLKKLQKKQKKGKYDGPALPETIVLDIPSPSVWNTLPFQLPRFLWFCVTLCPQSIQLFREYLAERKRRKEEEEQMSEESEPELEVARGPRRRRGKFALPESRDSRGCILDPVEAPEEKEVDKPKSAPISGGLWTDDDLVELIRLVKKFPPGTPSRWEKVGSAMNRSVGEVTHMAKKVKDDGYRVGKPEGEVEEDSPDDDKRRKVKTKGGKLGAKLLGSEEDGSDEGEGEKEPIWGQPQQKALEIALIKFPKGGTQDRWEKIAKCVPGKTKEECILRYKQLVELVKKRKVNGDASTNNTSGTIETNSALT
uniref:DnaJ-like protein n=1 Tax=Timema douglasi TaxID=61478 RepID=A0A7R8VCA3_TIMDO|nr:unnamed protein product [Timema douglasi]